MASNLEHGCFVNTKNQPHHFRLVWKIENFLEYPVKIGSFIRSPPFTCTKGTDYGVKFYLEIYPQGFICVTDEFVHVYLKTYVLPENMNFMKASFNVSLIDSRRKKAIEKHWPQYDFDDLKIGPGCYKFSTLQELRKNAEDWLPGGHLTVECNVMAHFELKNSVSTVRIQSEASGRISVDLGAEVLRMVYEEKICPDVKLKASDGQVFDAHKCILAARSPYFKAMFQHPMKENQEGLVDLSEDMNGQELEAFLHYIYLNTPPSDFGNTALKMFQIGEMQGIQGLRQISERTLIGQLNDDNALDFLIFANQHDAKELRKAAALLIAYFEK